MNHEDLADFQGQKIPIRDFQSCNWNLRKCAVLQKEHTSIPTGVETQQMRYRPSSEPQGSTGDDSDPQDTRVDIMKILVCVTRCVVR